jgi:hypothetical protein
MLMTRGVCDCCGATKEIEGMVTNINQLELKYMLIHICNRALATPVNRSEPILICESCSKAFAGDMLAYATSWIERQKKANSKNNRFVKIQANAAKVEPKKNEAEPPSTSNGDGVAVTSIRCPVCGGQKVLLLHSPTGLLSRITMRPPPDPQVLFCKPPGAIAYSELSQERIEDLTDIIVAAGVQQCFLSSSCASCASATREVMTYTDPLLNGSSPTTFIELLVSGRLLPSVPAE